MKRVMMFGGFNQRPAEALNEFLTKRPDFKLMEVNPVRDGINNILLYCIMEIPDDVRGLSESLSEYLGLSRKQEEGEEREEESE